MREKIYITEELFEHIRTLAKSELMEDGRELPNPEPLVIHTGLERPLTLNEQIQRCMRQEISRQVAAQGMETFEESQDFEVEEPFDSEMPVSVHEMTEEEPLPNNVQDPEQVPAAQPDPEPAAQSDPEPAAQPEPDPAAPPETGSNAPDL